MSGENGYYDTHDTPKAFSLDDLILTAEALDWAIIRTLTELFRTGMFENPCRDPAKAVEIFDSKEDHTEAELAHHKSAVLLKNDGTLPLTADRLEI